MPIAVQCPECSSRLNAPDAAAGKTLSCPKCNAALHVPAAAPAFEVVDEAPPPPPKPAPPRHPAAAFPAAILVDDDEVPRGKGRKKGPGKPKSRGPLIAYVRFHEVDSTVHVLAARGLDTMTPPAEWERFAASYELRKP